MKSTVAAALVLALAACSYQWDVPCVGTTQEDILRWVADEIDYVSDTEQYGWSDYWASPLETYASRVGDCEDIALIAMYLLHRDAGVESELVCIERPDWDAVHAVLRVDGVDFEPRTGSPAEYAPYFVSIVYSYSAAMARVGRHY